VDEASSTHPSVPRHQASFASHFMMRGGQLLELKEVLGHQTLAMTTRYAHLSPAHLRSAMDRTSRKPAEAFLGTTRWNQDVVRTPPCSGSDPT